MKSLPSLKSIIYETKISKGGITNDKRVYGRIQKRLFKALIVGAVFVAFMLISPLLTGVNPFAQIPWYLVPVVLVITVFYGTGWYFAFNLVKRMWRKFLRVNRDASIVAAITGRGIIVGFAYSLLCLTIGCFISFIVDNWFMIYDYILARQGKPPVSVKYKFDSDLEYDTWVDAVRLGVAISESENGVTEEEHYKNESALDDIANGNSGTIITHDEEGNTKKTTFIQ